MIKKPRVALLTSFITVACVCSAAVAQTPAISPPSLPSVIPPKQEPPTGAKLTTPSPEECLRRVRGFEPTLQRLREGCKSTLAAIIPDPMAYEKTLPPFDKVVADKDLKNLKNYGGLSEAFYYAGNAEKGKELFSQFEKNAALLGSDDTFLSLVKGDIGLLFFFDKNYTDAEPMILDSVKNIESHMTAANSNNVLSAYMCLSLIYDKTGKTEKSLEYATKAVDLAIRQRQEPMN